MTLNEAIKHCEEVAEQNEQGLYDAIALGGQNPTQEEIANCRECAANHRQLAEWLTELKDLREENKVLTRDCLRLIKSNDKLRKKVKVIAKYKRLLKVAVEDMNSNNICFDINACNVCAEKNCISCDTFHWRYTDEAEKLLNAEK